MGENLKVAIKMHVQFNGPVVIKVKDTFVTNCEEGGWRMYQSGGWCWVTNGKWQMEVAVELDGPWCQWQPESMVDLWQIVGKLA